MLRHELNSSGLGNIYKVFGDAHEVLDELLLSVSHDVLNLLNLHLEKIGSRMHVVLTLDEEI